MICRAHTPSLSKCTSWRSVSPCSAFSPLTMISDTIGQCSAMNPDTCMANKARALAFLLRKGRFGKWVLLHLVLILLLVDVPYAVHLVDQSWGHCPFNSSRTRNWQRSASWSSRPCHHSCFHQLCLTRELLGLTYPAHYNRPLKSVSEHLRSLRMSAALVAAANGFCSGCYWCRTQVLGPWRSQSVLVISVLSQG